VGRCLRMPALSRHAYNKEQAEEDEEEREHH
jgi:hypothetical protein